MPGSSIATAISAACSTERSSGIALGASRQEGIFARAGVTIPRSTLAQWVGTCGVRLQPLVVQHQFRQLLQLRILGLEHLETFGVIHLQAAELGPPTVEGRIIEAVLTTQRLRRYAALRLAEKIDDLLFREPLYRFLMPVRPS